MELTPKQENFCNYYIETGNASEAYRRAYDCGNMSDNVVNVKASELLNNGKITVRISELQNELKAKSDITKERILKELECIAFADIGKYVEIKSGNVVFKDSSEWTEDMRKAVESIEKNSKEGIKIKLHGKNWSIARICRMLGFDEEEKDNDIEKRLIKINTGSDD
ncbi:hypothetical protein EZS27_008899 [termite gut metagenome]|uniref:Terminase small subunit n=1 Tax=termite gut metagenome TaxID=433724 RepID=A0A5J4SBM9_9ZZZZ